MSRILLLLSLAVAPLAALAQQDDPIGCYVPGECTRSLVFDTLSAGTPFECLQRCNEYSATEDRRCEYFTHFIDSEVCRNKILTVPPTGKRCDA